MNASVTKLRTIFHCAVTEQIFNIDFMPLPHCMLELAADRLLRRLPSS